MSPIHQKRDLRAFERLRMATARVAAYVWEEGDLEPIKGFSFVADLSETGVGLYLREKIKPSMHVLIAFEKELAPSLKARVAWCNRYSLEQRFIGHDAFSYRAGFLFLFATEMQRQQYLDYLKEVRERSKAVAPGIVF